MVTQFQTLILGIIFKLRLLFVSHFVICTVHVQHGNLSIRLSVAGRLLITGLDTSDFSGESVTSTQHNVKRHLILCLIKYRVNVT